MLLIKKLVEQGEQKAEAAIYNFFFNQGFTQTSAGTMTSFFITTNS